MLKCKCPLVTFQKHNPEASNWKSSFSKISRNTSLLLEVKSPSITWNQQGKIEENPVVKSDKQKA